MDIGPSELIIILIIVLLLFGGSRLAGLGKSAGRALREFKEETSDPSPLPSPPQSVAPPVQHPVSVPPNASVPPGSATPAAGQPVEPQQGQRPA